MSSLSLSSHWKSLLRFFRLLGGQYCTVREGSRNSAWWRCFQGLHTWTHLVNRGLNPPVQGAKIWYQASQIPQMVPNGLFPKHFQVACLFWISQALMGDIILASNYCQACTSLFPEDLAWGWIMNAVHLQHNALLCSLPPFRHSHSSYSCKRRSFTIFPPT